jgi:hypothetical protein
MRYLYDAVKNGQIFSVTFIKRTTGEERTMVCRVGVKSYLRGGSKTFNDTEKGLLTVFDMQKKGYRSIPLDAIIKVKVNKEVF